jgi:N-acetylglucosamine-6-phosphate deacetylase
MLALTGARVLVDGAFADGRAVLVDGTRIAAVVADGEVPAAARRRDLAGAMLVPGFLDTQVNGGGDALFNADPSVATIRRIGAAHARFGTTGFLPTLISDELPVIRAAVAAVDAAILEGVPGVLGIHIEGPFINAERKGIHAADKIRAIDEEGMAALTGLRHGRTLVTLAPELAGPAVIARLVAAGVTVSAGHTAGTFDQVAAGIAAGLTGVTHLFNAMPPLGNREPGPVGAALSAPDVWCGLIVDGIHVHPATLRLALAAKPLDRFMLVTDAMPPTGGRERSFLLNGRRILADGGRLVDEGGTLAGADLDMLSAVRNAVAMLGVTPAAAIAMASANPAAFIGLGHALGRIAPGYRASLLAIDDDWRIAGRWIDGAEGQG